jgi:Holliday junction resolvasome RuvABC DNA-binding subunit
MTTCADASFSTTSQLGLFIMIVAVNGLGARTDIRIYNAMKRAEQAAKRGRSAKKSILSKQAKELGKSQVKGSGAPQSKE